MLRQLCQFYSIFSRVVHNASSLNAFHSLIHSVSTKMARSILHLFEAARVGLRITNFHPTEARSYL
eukprot:m.106588 g.106588  ORF g.106588 m.106588 type:complete len:66 (+) comp13307_c0_seq4:2568-2765(+)